VLTITWDYTTWVVAIPRDRLVTFGARSGKFKIAFKVRVVENGGEDFMWVPPQYVGETRSIWVRQ